MVYTYGLHKGPDLLAKGASERKRVSIDATCCHSPAKSYMPQVCMTLSMSLTWRDPSARSPVAGFKPPFASVAAMTARSGQVTRTEHCRK